MKIMAFDPVLRRSLGDVYDILEPIGQGGMAQVFLANHKGLDRQVAIKVQAHDGSGGSLSFERASFEAKTLARLSHPNLIQIFEFRAIGEMTILVCEFASGEDLSRMMARRKRIPVGETVTLLTQILGGLAHLHDHQIVHRDLKPANILLTDPLLDGVPTVKLADFGLALGLDRDYHTQARVIMGTIPYMSPEQLLGESVDHRADIYSLGIILHEMIAGEHPFGELPDREMIHRHLREGAPVLSRFVPDVPRWLEGLTARLLEKEASHRPPNAGAIIELIPPKFRFDRPGPLIDPDSSPFELERTRAVSRSRLANSRPPRIHPDVISVTKAFPQQRPCRSATPHPWATPGRPASPGNSRPGHPWVLALAGALVLSGVVSGFFLLRPTARTTIDRVEIAVWWPRVAIETRFSGLAPEFGLLGMDLPWVPCVDGGSVSVQVPPTLEDSQSIDVGIRVGTRDVLTISLPRIPPMTRDDFETLRIPGADSRIEGWVAHFRGPREDLFAEVSGTVSAGFVEFRSPRSIQDWHWIQLESITGRWTGREGESAKGSGTLRIHCGQSVVTDSGMRSWLRPGVSRLYPCRTSGTHDKNPRMSGGPLFSLAFNPAGNSSEEANLVSRLGEAYRHFFLTDSVPLDRKIRTNDWLRELGNVYVGLLRWDIDRVPAIEDLLNGLVKVRHQDLPPDFDVGALPADRIHILRVPRLDEDFSVLSTQEVSYTIMKPRLLTDGYPPVLAAPLEEENIRIRHPIALPPVGLLKGTDRIVLGLNLWNFRIAHVLTLEISDGVSPSEISIWNFTNERNHGNPLSGHLLHRDTMSWQNIPWTAGRVDVEFPAQMVKNRSSQISIRFDRAYGSEEEPMNYIGIIGYDWSRP